MNLTLNLKSQSDASTLVKEFFNLTNLLIYPQRLKLSSNPEQDNYESQQERVRDIILYLKVMKQVLKLQDDKDLFSLSDVIDETNLNCQSLIYHLMIIYERILGKQTNKIYNLSAYEILELQRDLEPLVLKQANILDQDKQPQYVVEPQPVQKESKIEDKQEEYYSNLKKLEKKLLAYKNEYSKVKLQNKKQEKIIIRYEEVIQQLGQKKQSKTKEQDLKTKIYEQFIASMKVDYESELNNLKQQQANEIRSRSVSPINTQEQHIKTPQPQPNKPKLMSIDVQTDRIIAQKSVQTDIDTRISELEELKLVNEALQKERENLIKDKKDLLLEKHGFNDKLSDIQQKYEQVLEELDQKNQKYQNIKKEIKRIQEEGENKGLGVERLKEEIQIAQRQKSEADNRTKKFEGQFRQALKEIDELREQLEELKDTKQEKEEDLNGSQGSSFNMFNHSQHQEIKLNELEKEKDFLLQKVQLLEKSNKELVNYKKSLEETLNEISKEQDLQKRMNMVDFNLIRRKSLLRLEAAHKDNKITSPEKSPINSSPNQYLGQRQSTFNHFTPGSKTTMMAPPSSYQENIGSGNHSVIMDNNQDLNSILDQIQNMESRSATPVNRLGNIQLMQSDPQDSDQILSQQLQQDIEGGLSRSEQIQQSLFGSAYNNIERVELLQQFKEQKSQLMEDNEEEEEKKEEEDAPEDNVMMKILKQKTQKLLDEAQNPQKDLQRFTISEAANEDEYDDEESSDSEDY